MKNHTIFRSNFKFCQHFIDEYRMIPYSMNIGQSKDVSSKWHAVPGQTEPRTVSLPEDEAQIRT